MRIEQVDFITIPTRDASRATAFYRDVLGLESSEKSDQELETPNVTLSFWNPESQGEEFVTNPAGFALRVDDVEEALEEVRAAGGEVRGLVDTGVCNMGFIHDPDGNTVILHRRYAPYSDGTRPDE
jgi:catechol 2,3-dioxygenase-like lactoylglutathione lyase family enzyme